MEHIIEFLRQLSVNNNREWFNAHKEVYLNAKREFDAFVERLIPMVQQFDSSIGNLTVSDCTWRIYRDVRFSHDKRPYKTYMGCYFAPQGKRGPYSGYYFQMGIDDEDGTVNGMLATGNYYTEPAVLKILREDIEMDEGNELQASIDRAKGFQLDDSMKLKRVPRGYDAECPYGEYLKYKNLCLIKHIGTGYLKSKNLEKKIVADMNTTKDFLHFINRAIAFHIEQRSN
ncbi:MAG: DUF2461 domain-containing protein [Clostridiales bacterium]|nr:DUF2461 domain-containing protein [Clostridiales bacterium]